MKTDFELSSVQFSFMARRTWAAPFRTLHPSMGACPSLMPIHCTFIPRAEAVLTLGTAQQLGENGFFFPPPSEGRVSLTSYSPVLRVATSVSTRCCVACPGQCKQWSRFASRCRIVVATVVLRLGEGESRERFTSRGEGSSTALYDGWTID